MAIPREVRRRLAALGSATSSASAPTSEPLQPEPPPAGLRWVAPAEEMPPGVEIVMEYGPLFSHRLEPAEAGEWVQQVVDAALENLTAAWGETARSAHGFCCLDIETTGLSSERIFLIGLLHVGQGGQLHAHQYLARDYSEEQAMLAESARMLRGAPLWLSYNGRSFDLPFIQDRLRYHRLEPLDRGHRHLDLLHPARRSYRRLLPNCRLVTLEEHICRRRRLDDVEGALIPQAYRRYVSTGLTDQLAVIVQHNLLDLITLLEIAAGLRPELE